MKKTLTLLFISGMLAAGTLHADETLTVDQEKGIDSTELLNISNITQEGNWAASRYLQRIKKADTVWQGTSGEAVNYSDNTVINTESYGTRAGVLALESDNYYKAENVPGLTIQGFGDISFDRNTTTSYNAAQGGVVYIVGEADRTSADYAHAVSGLSINNNGTVSFDANSVTANDRTAYGGAMHMGARSTVEITGNDKVSFNDNKLNATKNYAYGGAVYLTGNTNRTADLSVSGNVDVSFSGNAVTASNYVYGGAISSRANTNVAIEGNTGKVDISNNSVALASSSGTIRGGAIYSEEGATLSIAGNKEVIFAGNYEKTGDTYRLRSIYSAESSPSSDSGVKLSAAADGKIEFRDSVYIQGNVKLNDAYGDEAQTGKIIFTGRTTESDLNAVIAANTAEGETARSATASEINNSRSSTITGSVTLMNGTLSLQDGAKLTISGGLTVTEGATLEVLKTPEVDTASSIALFAAVEPELQELETAAVLNANLTLEDNSIVNLNNGSLDLGGKALTMGQNIMVNFTGSNLSEGNYELFTNVGKVADGATEFNLVVNGEAVTATYDATNKSIVTYVTNIPEPTTATLSLLALAALAARRRRK